MKRIAAFLALIMLATLCACAKKENLIANTGAVINKGTVTNTGADTNTDSIPTPQIAGMSLPRMPDKGEITELTITPTGSIHDIITSTSGYTITTIYADGCIVEHYDKTGESQWEYRYTRTGRYTDIGNPTITALTNGNTLLALDNQRLTALSSEGQALWTTTLPTFFAADLILPDKDGGITCFGLRFENDKDRENREGGKNIAIRISANGELVEQHDLHAKKAWMYVQAAPEGGYIWNLASGGIGDPDGWRGIKRLKDDFSVEWQYPIESDVFVHDVAASMDGHVLLLLSCHDNESGILIELDRDGDTLFTIETGNQIPTQVVYLSDGKKAVLLQNRKELHEGEGGRYRIYSGSEMMASIELSYSLSWIYPLEDGSFTLAGDRTAPGQSAGQRMKSMFSSSFAGGGIVFDYVVERYNSNAELLGRRTYIREKNNSNSIRINNDITLDADSLNPWSTMKNINIYRQLLTDGTVMIVKSSTSYS